MFKINEKNIYTYLSQNIINKINEIIINKYKIRNYTLFIIILMYNI